MILHWILARHHGAAARAGVPRRPGLFRQLQARARAGDLVADGGRRARRRAPATALNGLLLDRIDIGYVPYSRWISPWLEESLKAALIVYLIRTRRVGMLVDAAIYGFAIGTGFALVENLYLPGDRGPRRILPCRSSAASARRSCTAAPPRSSPSSRCRRPSGFPDKWLRVFLPGLVAAVDPARRLQHAAGASGVRDAGRAACCCRR